MNKMLFILILCCLWQVAPLFADQEKLGPSLTNILEPGTIERLTPVFLAEKRQKLLESFVGQENFATWLVELTQNLIAPNSSGRLKRGMAFGPPGNGKTAMTTEWFKSIGFSNHVLYLDLKDYLEAHPNSLKGAIINGAMINLTELGRKKESLDPKNMEIFDSQFGKSQIKSPMVIILDEIGAALSHSDMPGFSSLWELLGEGSFSIPNELKKQIEVNLLFDHLPVHPDFDGTLKEWETELAKEENEESGASPEHKKLITEVRERMKTLLRTLNPDVTVDFSGSLVLGLGNLPEGVGVGHMRSLHVGQLPQLLLNFAVPPERISRLGHNYFIVNGVDEKAYKTYIDRTLKASSDGEVALLHKTHPNVDVTFVYTKTFSKRLYDECVVEEEQIRPLQAKIQGFMTGLSKVMEDVANGTSPTSVAKVLIEVDVHTHDPTKAKWRLKIDGKRKSERLEDIPSEKWRLTVPYSPPKGELVAAHEAAHATVALAVTGKIPKFAVSRNAEGGGATQLAPKRDGDVTFSRDLLDFVTVAVAAMEGEKLLYPEKGHSEGAVSDIHQATAQARLLVTELGYGAQLVRSGTFNRGEVERDEKGIEADIQRTLAIAHDRSRKILLEQKNFWRELSLLLTRQTEVSEKEMGKLKEQFWVKATDLSLYHSQPDLSGSCQGRFRKIARSN